MKKEIITTCEYGAYKMDYEIHVEISETVQTNEKGIMFFANCSCIVSKSEYNECAAKILKDAMIDYCNEIILIKKTSAFE